MKLLCASLIRHAPDIPHGNPGSGKDLNSVTGVFDHLTNSVCRIADVRGLPAGQNPCDPKIREQINGFFPVRDHIYCPVENGFLFRTCFFVSVLLKL